jgi:hypothetical protein
MPDDVEGYQWKWSEVNLEWIKVSPANFFD